MPSSNHLAAPLTQFDCFSPTHRVFKTCFHPFICTATHSLIGIFDESKLNVKKFREGSQTSRVYRKTKGAYRETQGAFRKTPGGFS